MSGTRFGKCLFGLLLAEAAVEQATVEFCAMGEVQRAGMVFGNPGCRQWNPFVRHCSETRFYNVFRNLPFAKFSSNLDWPVVPVKSRTDERFREALIGKRAFPLQIFEQLRDELLYRLMRQPAPFELGAKFSDSILAPGKEPPSLDAQIIQRRRVLVRTTSL